MYLVSNYKKRIPFNIGKKNALVVLSSEKNGVQFKATESNTLVNYFVRKSSDPSDTFEKKDLVPAKFFAVETIFEKERTEEPISTFDYLITDFGDRLSKDKIKKRNINQVTKAQLIKVNVENQLLPNFNKDTSDPKEVYDLDYMFDKDTIVKFTNIDLEIDELCEYVKAKEYDERLRPIYFIIDCFCTLLNEKFITPTSIPKHYKFYYEDIKKNCNKGRLDSLAKDKMAVIVYILLLKINNYTLRYEDIPKFDMVRSKTFGMLRMIGCTISKGGNVIDQINMPVETYTKR